MTGPDGRPWIDTTVRGQAERGTGILNNTLYVGKLSWNRCSYVKDPQTGKRVARPNPQEHWEVTEVPDLRIVDDETWERAKARQSEKSFEIGRDETGNPLNKAHQRHSCSVACSSAAVAAAATPSWVRTGMDVPRGAARGFATTAPPSRGKRSKPACWAGSRTGAGAGVGG